MGVRDIPIDFIIDPKNKKYPTYFSGGKEKTFKLAESIKENGIKSPMILVWDNNKYPYVLEGSTRYDALLVLNAQGEKLPKTIPALSIVDTSKDIRLMPQGKSNAKPTSSSQKNTTQKRNLDNSVATGIAVALGSSGEKRNE